MLTELLLEIGATVLLFSTLLITCAVLWGARPPRGPRR